jgi:hypothetical protein
VTEANRRATNPFGWPEWLWWLGVAATALVFAVCLTHQVTSAARHFGAMSEGGDPGLAAVPSSKTPG